MSGEPERTSATPRSDETPVPESPVVAEPENVERIVEELKFQGVFDQFRKECLAEADTKPAYQNLRQKVEGTTTSFLNKEIDQYDPKMNKAQLRNKLRSYLQQTSYMDAGVERIVDQSVNPNVYSSIKSEVKSIVHNIIQTEKPAEVLKNGENDSSVENVAATTDISQEEANSSVQLHVGTSKSSFQPPNQDLDGSDCKHDDAKSSSQPPKQDVDGPDSKRDDAKSSSQPLNQDVDGPDCKPDDTKRSSLPLNKDLHGSDCKNDDTKNSSQPNPDVPDCKYDGKKGESIRKERRSSKDHKEHKDHRRSHKYHHKDKERSRRPSSSKHERSSKDEKNSKPHKSDKKSSTDKGKESKKEDKKEKLEKIDLKIREKSSLKSDSFKDFDMFAPKPPKPKVPRPGGFASPVGSSSPLLSHGVKSPFAWGAKTPPTFGSKTPPSFGSKSSASGNSDLRRQDSLSKPSKERRASHEASKSISIAEGSKKEQDTIILQERVEPKKYPELPIPKVEGDKFKQYEDDFMNTKKKLEESRNKRMIEAKQRELEKKMQKSASKSTKPKKEIVKPAKPPKQNTEEGAKKKKKDTSMKSDTEIPKKRLRQSNDEDEMSDWSESKSLNLRKRKSGRNFIVSDEEDDDEVVNEGETANEEEILNKKEITNDEETVNKEDEAQAEKLQAERIFESDPETPSFRGFEQVDIDKALNRKIQVEKAMEEREEVQDEKLQAKTILESDPETQVFKGFEQLDIDRAMEQKEKMYKDINMLIISGYAYV